MTAPSSRLLVALKAADETRRAVSETLPDVPWVFVSESAAPDWSAVEALLVGSVERDLGAFDPTTAPRLAFVQRLYTGLDGFPFDRFPPAVRIAGNVGGFGPFVAEGAVTLALASSRSTVTAHRMVSEGRMRPPPPGLSLRGKTAVILGYGEIGREIAVRVAALGMRVVGVNRRGQMAPGVEAMYPADRLDDALAEGDVVFEVRPLTRATRGSLGRAQFERMPANAVFVNVGRAGTVVEDDLYEHLRTHPTFRAGLDVWWEEGFGDGKLQLRHPWTDLPNLTAAPHIAAAVPEAADYSLRRALENLRRFFDGATPLFLADRADYAGLGPTSGSVPARTNR